MSHELFWTAVAKQAETWRALPTFRRFTAQLPRNARDRTRGVPGLLQRLGAGGAWVESRPLRIATVLPMWLDAMAEPVPDEAALSSWLDDARRVERAHRETVAWLRSRLPGYPLLPAPQLAAGTPLTTAEFTWRLAWGPNERSQGLHLLPAPPNPSRLLDVAGAQRHELDQRARTVAAELVRCDEVQRLAAATDALDDEARQALRAARSSIRQRLEPAAVDGHEPDLALPRDAFRQEVVREEVESLSGAAREYAASFDAANDLAELGTSDVFSQLAAHGGPMSFGPARDIDVRGHHPQVVSFTIDDDVLVHPGMVGWLEDSLLSDALQVTEVSINFHRTTGVEQTVAASRLEGTSAAWR